ncbi:hypothetical protein DV738_g4374, partial [Chaetothyriales sp. CBS 135597]
MTTDGLPTSDTKIGGETDKWWRCTGGADHRKLDIVNGVPSLLIKWAEEGYSVVEIQADGLDQPESSLKRAIEALKQLEECDLKDKFALVAYDAQLWNKVAPVLPAVPEIVGAVVYADEADAQSTASQASIPALWHIAGKAAPASTGSDGAKKYYYPTAQSSKFATPFHPHFHYNSEALTHTRNLTHLKPLLGGPYFDLDTIWDEHTYYEFADRSVEHTMSTMVQEPYVNHVPTLTGGIGREALSKFYRDNFIFNNSADTELELISRIIGIDRVVDEFIFKFTHDRELDWLVPGIPPTQKKVEVPFTAVVNIRGDRLYHEHIAWDQCTVLRQLGLLPEYLPYPYPLPQATAEKTTPAGVIEYRVPTLGVETRRAAAPGIRWADDVIDNEGLGRKSSKVCCIYHRPRGVDESSDEDDSSSSSSSDSDGDSSNGGSDSGDDDGAARPTAAAKRRQGRGCGGGHDGHDHGKGKGRKGHKRGRRRKPSPNAAAAQATVYGAIDKLWRLKEEAQNRPDDGGLIAPSHRNDGDDNSNLTATRRFFRNYFDQQEKLFSSAPADLSLTPSPSPSPTRETPPDLSAGCDPHPATSSTPREENENKKQPAEKKSDDNKKGCGMRNEHDNNNNDNQIDSLQQLKVYTQDDNKIFEGKAIDSS